MMLPRSLSAADSEALRSRYKLVRRDTMADVLGADPVCQRREWALLAARLPRRAPGIQLRAGWVLDCCQISDIIEMPCGAKG
jgi:hypothetical protein